MHTTGAYAIVIKLYLQQKCEIPKLEVSNEKTQNRKREITKLEVGNEKSRNW